MNKKVQIIKVPSDKPPVETPAEFPRMPRMYLELLENKDKVKAGLVNKEYDPDEAATLFSWNGGNDDTNKNNLPTINEKDGVSDRDDEDIEEEEDEDEEDDDDDKEEEEEDDEDDKEEEEEDDDDDKGDEDEEDDGDEDEEDEEDEEDDDEEKKSLVSSKSSRSSKKPVENTTRNHILDMLDAKTPPKLSDLEKRGEVRTEKVVANFNRMNLGSEEEDELKRELLFKFELLKKSYKNVEIPDFTMHSDFQNMNRTYENTVRRVSLDSSVEQYKSLLIGGFMLIEFIMGVWLKFDMAGFTQQQILNMSQYERLLIELGEKSYVPGGSQWPIEVRLLGLILLNSVIFVVSKMIVKKTGSNLINMMNVMNTGVSNINTRPKRKMKGPSISVEDLPEEDE